MSLQIPTAPTSSAPTSFAHTPSTPTPPAAAPPGPDTRPRTRALAVIATLLAVAALRLTEPVTLPLVLAVFRPTNRRPPTAPSPAVPFRR